MISGKRFSKLLTKKARKEFGKFMNGQTISENPRDKNDCLIQDDDVLRFIKRLPVVD